MTTTSTAHVRPIESRAALVVLPWLVRLRWVSVVALAGGAGRLTTPYTIDGFRACAGGVWPRLVIAEWT